MFQIIDGDLSVTTHAEAVVDLLNEYASDPLGGGAGLGDYAKKHLVDDLRKRPTAYLVLAFDGSTAAGLVTCFEGFSTFACRPLLNIHDVVVSKPYRGQGLSKLMLAKVEEHAIQTDCCKLTLEVLEGNAIAQQAYRSFGFENYVLDPAHGRAMFWQKRLGDREKPK